MRRSGGARDRRQGRTRGDGTAGGARLLGAALLLAAGCASGCVSSGYADRGQSSSADLAELKRRVIELQQQARMSELEIARLRERVAELEARLRGDPPAPEDPPPVTRQGSAGIPSASEASDLETPAPPLMEELDLEDEPESESGSSDSRGTDNAKRRGPAVTPDAQRLYDQGYTLYHRGRYLDAETTFRRFLGSHGDTDLADNAQYWIGEARYARGDLRGALSAFRETVERYPDGNKVPDALVKAGQALEALGDVEGARETYSEVLRRFAESPAASVAREHLSRLP